MPLTTALRGFYSTHLSDSLLRQGACPLFRHEPVWGGHRKGARSNPSKMVLITATTPPSTHAADSSSHPSHSTLFFVICVIPIPDTPLRVLVSLPPHPSTTHIIVSTLSPPLMRNRASSTNLRPALTLSTL